MCNTAALLIFFAPVMKNISLLLICDSTFAVQVHKYDSKDLI